MKRRDLIKKLGEIAKAGGDELVLREGGDHTVVRIGKRQDSVPRHSEINEITAKKIIRKMEGK